jgi:hypothetical protein
MATVLRERGRRAVLLFATSPPPWLRAFQVLRTREIAFGDIQ